MNLNFYFARLSANAITIENLVKNLTVEQTRWKSAPDKWSIAQIIFHLLQIEIKDFRPRLEKTLRNSNENWAPLDAQEMRLKEDSKEKIEDFLRIFLQERENLIAWLKTLENPAFENTHQHEQLKFSGGDLLASWLAHDFLHIKQITRVHYDYVNQISQPYKTDYAGDWT